MRERIVKGYKFRIYPTDEQKIFFAKSFGCCRVIFNRFLEERKKHYLDNKQAKRLNYHDNARSLTNLKKDKDFKWLNEVNSQSLQAELRDLEIAYVRFLKKLASFPVFKSKRDGQSFTIPQHFEFNGNLLTVPKLNSPIKVIKHRDFGQNHEIRFVTISKTKTNKYFVSFTVEEDADLPPKNGNKVGIDLGLDNLLTISDGTKIKNPKIAWEKRKKLKYLHRQLSKKQKGGKNREKARNKLARDYEKITNIKNDYVHKLTSRIVNENQVIVMESLDIVGMMKDRRLARSIGEVSWYEIIRQLSYKSDWKGREFILINRFFPSSKTCFDCLYINQFLSLSDRHWICPNCGKHHNRDHNAAMNILRQGLNDLNSGEGHPSESKQKLGFSFRRKGIGVSQSGGVDESIGVSLKGNQVVEPRSPML